MKSRTEVPGHRKTFVPPIKSTFQKRSVPGFKPMGTTRERLVRCRFPGPEPGNIFWPTANFTFPPWGGCRIPPRARFAPGMEPHGSPRARNLGDVLWTKATQYLPRGTPLSAFRARFARSGSENQKNLLQPCFPPPPGSSTYASTTRFLFTFLLSARIIFS